MKSKNYTSRKSRLLKKFDRSIGHIKGVLDSRYGEEQANAEKLGISAPPRLMVIIDPLLVLFGSTGLYLPIPY